VSRRRTITLLVVVAVAVIVIVVTFALHRPPHISVPAHHGTPPHLKIAFGSSLRLGPAEHDGTYLRDFLKTFSSLTPENDMKWAETEPRQGHYTLGDADGIVDFARRTHRRVRGHNLVWDEQLPDWLTHGHFDAHDLRSILTDHIRTLVSHWRGKIAEWDVVNEPLDADGSLTHDLWLRGLGRSYIPYAFKVAHRADPHARLFVNEYAVGTPGAKQNGLYRLVSRLVHRGVPIGGVGFENHTTLTDAPTQAQLEHTFRRFTALGVHVEVTEMDVVIPRHRPTTRATLKRQARDFGAAARACAAVARCTGFTVWGVDDKYSWKGAGRRPLLYNARGRAKPALHAVLHALGAH
jgi:endo-1,4-beta-xylanase